jgi:TonB family protein
MRREILARGDLPIFADPDRTFRRVLTVLLSFYLFLIFFIRVKGEAPLPGVPISPAEDSPRIARLLTEPQQITLPPPPHLPSPKVEAPPLPPAEVEPPMVSPPAKVDSAEVEKSAKGPSPEANGGGPSPPKAAPRERIKKKGLLGLLGREKGSAPSLGGFSALKDLPPLPFEEKTAGSLPESDLQDGSDDGIDEIRERVLSEQERRLAQLSAGGSGAGQGGERGAVEVADKPLSSILSGSARTRGDVDAVVQQNKEKLLLSYNRFLQKNPDLQGSLTVEFIITAEGQVFQCHVLSSSLNDPGFEEAVVREILQWRFPSVEGGSTTVLYPVFFYPAG